MTDIATRVYNHTWKIDPIVRSVLDTDFYKLLMAQTIFRRHKDARVTFGILNRTRSVKLARLVDVGELKEQLGQVADEAVVELHRRSLPLPPTPSPSPQGGGGFA